MRVRPRPPALMLQGTGSDVGKSLLTAGLARAFTRRGLSVRPFKPQNMSNNAAVTADGGEIGRAQALQARAAQVAPSVHMNPVLLKPETDRRAQVVVQGKALAAAEAADYQALKARLLGAVLESFGHLEAEAELVLVEGAGSPAEINLRANDIANMGFARSAGVPVVLVGDIDRGGVIAALVGTQTVLDPADAAQIKGFIVNKFRGDVSLFDGGLRAIEARTGWPSFGVVPWFRDVALLPAEDAVVLERPAESAARPLRIAVPMLSRIANFDDLDPLRAEPDAEILFIPPGQMIPRDVDLILLPGTKATLADLAFLRAQGWDLDILSHHRHGGAVFGICGGYQMLGRRVHDPAGVEGVQGSQPGLGLLDVETQLAGAKILRPVEGTTPTGIPVSGYEIHIGRTEGPDTARPLLLLPHGLDGAQSRDGRASGCYLHGLFASDAYRADFLARFRPERRASAGFEAKIETVLDGLADHLETHLNLDALWAVAQQRG